MNDNIIEDFEKIKKQILVSILYTLVMGLGWWINPYPYGDIENVIFRMFRT